MFFFYITIILVSFFHVHSLTCKLILTCKASCDNAIKINWEDNAESSIDLGTPNDNTATFSKQYPGTNFVCEPGDKIKFNNNAYEEVITGTYEGGFIGKLIVGTKTFESYSTPTTIFACDSGCTTSSSTLNFYDGSNLSTMIEFSAQLKTFTIEIPYEINNINTVTIDIIELNPQNFLFEDYVIPKITGATKNRLKVKIITIPDINYALLSKNSNNIAANSEVSLEDSITFSLLDENFGLFELTYKVKILSQEETVTHSIKFNVCYKYCATCGAYSSINPSEKQCTTCVTDAYKIDDVANGVENDRCFSLANEINQHYTNYYLDSGVYKRCDQSCLTCQTSNMNCNTCNILYYFVEDLSNNDKQCYYINEISDNYYLDQPPDGTTFKICDNNCQTCKLQSDNCFSCATNTFFNSGEVNKCQSAPSGNYFLVNNLDTNTYIATDTYIMQDSSCDLVNNNVNKKICSVCAANYYKKEDDEKEFCYLKEEANYEYGIKTYLDQSENKFKTCDTQCLICENSSDNCLKCSANYYFVEGEAAGACKNIDDIHQLEISNNIKYFLPEGSDKYEKCDLNCICEKKKRILHRLY